MMLPRNQLKIEKSKTKSNSWAMRSSSRFKTKPCHQTRSSNLTFVTHPIPSGDPHWETVGGGTPCHFQSWAVPLFFYFRSFLCINLYFGWLLFARLNRTAELRSSSRIYVLDMSPDKIMQMDWFFPRYPKCTFYESPQMYISRDKTCLPKCIFHETNLSPQMYISCNKLVSPNVHFMSKMYISWDKFVSQNVHFMRQTCLTMLGTIVPNIYRSF